MKYLASISVEILVELECDVLTIEQVEQAYSAGDWDIQDHSIRHIYCPQVGVVIDPENIV